MAYHHVSHYREQHSEDLPELLAQLAEQTPKEVLSALLKRLAKFNTLSHDKNMPMLGELL
ncbi:MAG: hypothetical protein ABFS56_25745 [Pseudomonadota bacterium]